MFSNQTKPNQKYKWQYFYQAEHTHESTCGNILEAQKKRDTFRPFSTTLDQIGGEMQTDLNIGFRFIVLKL